MDPELLKQRAAFQKHASRTMAVQQRPQAAPASSSHSTYNAEEAKKKKKAKRPEPEQAASKEFDYKTAQSHSNAANFGTMAKIVDYMKKRHLNQQQWSLSLQEILEELQIFDLPNKSINWLKEALPINPRLTVDEDGKFSFKPPYKIKGKTSLLSVAKKFHQDGKGGILLSDLNECVPQADKMLEAMGTQLIVVQTAVNKRKDKVFFFNDTDLEFELEDDFRSLWRSIGVDHLDEKKIEEYLSKHGIDTMKDLAPKRAANQPLKRKAVKRKGNQKVHNEHLADVLQDYQ